MQCFKVNIAQVYLSGFVKNDVKLEETWFQLWYLITLNHLPQPFQPLALTYETVPPWDCRLHWFLFFFLPPWRHQEIGPGSSCLWTQPYVNQTEGKLAQLWLVAWFIVL